MQMNPAFRFARGGKVYKELEADEAHEIPGFIRTGIISLNDDYWTPGMGDWKKVYSRQWNFAPPSSSELPPAATNSSKPTAPTPTAAPASGGATIQSFLQATTAYSYECATCEKGFNDPAKAPSGYSVIGKAAVFFILGMVLLGISLPIYLNWTMPAFFGDSRANFVIATIVYMLVSLSGFGLLLMSVFELIASAVTHGIYRANPERCPHCKSPTFTRKG
jgi:DNA-directed RNA polymerase subunit RPC12/RpoP